MQNFTKELFMLSDIMLSVIILYAISPFWIVLVVRRKKYFGTASFKNVNNCLNTNIYSYLETSGGQSSNLNLNVVHFFNTFVN
jgi:hypothetical protein